MIHYLQLESLRTQMWHLDKDVLCLKTNMVAQLSPVSTQVRDHDKAGLTLAQH